jgi:hypothetical protein
MSEFNLVARIAQGFLAVTIVFGIGLWFQIGMVTG